MLKIILILTLFLSSCSFIVAKKAVDVVDNALDRGPNPEKKEKIIKKQNKIKDKAKEFYCSKVKDEEKCGNE